MPDGDNCNIQQKGVSGNYGRSVKLLDSVPSSKATSNVYIGPWVDISTLKNATVQTDATGLTGSVNIEGSNADNPVAATTGYALCSAQTASGLVMLTTMPVRWVRARVTGFTAGSVNVQLHGVS